MRKFNEEVSHWKDYNYIVINDDLEICYKKILDIIESEKEGISQKQDLSEIVSKVNKLVS
jgi:guanylate kinase